MMQGHNLFSISLALLLSACSASEPSVTNEQPEETVNPMLDASSIEDIAGHEGHNLMARESALGRGMALANVVKSLEGKQYCSPNRTLFRGAERGTSVWAIECHDGAAFQVVVEKDGTGGTVSCEIVSKLGDGDNCWKPFASQASTVSNSK